MSFAETEFLPFLALVLALWTFVPARGRVPFLLVASWTFYLWASALHGLLLLFSTVLDYAVALAIARAERQGVRRALLWTSVACNVGLLAVFKYAGFAAENWSALTGEPVDFVGFALPLGISFYTFQTLSYTIDVYRGRLRPCRDFVEYALYVSFFPQLVAGPIERASHLLPQLRATRQIDGTRLSAGARRILWGLGKKWVVADRLADHVWPVFSDPAASDSLALALAAVGMATVLYVDFSAYSDIAIGAARLFGVELVENFRRPFLATSVDQYVRRWHVSLMTWMYDYVHEPLSRGRISHATSWSVNLLVMGLFGLWHGARWTFVLWGLSFGVLVSLGHSRRIARARRGLRSAGAGGAGTGLSWLGTLVFVCQFIVLFFAPDVAFAADYFAAELALRAPEGIDAWRWIGTTSASLGLLLAVHSAGEWLDLNGLWARIGTAGRLVAWVGGALALAMLRVPHADPFIYFGF